MADPNTRPEAHGGVDAGIPSGAPEGKEKELPVVGPSFNAAYLHNTPPQYPAVARRLRLQGTAMIRVLVSPEGRPKSVKLQQSSGVQILDDAALEAVQEWSFVPARQGKKPIAAEVDVPVSFRLEGTTVE
jgi:protein TonB